MTWWNHDHVFFYCRVYVWPYAMLCVSVYAAVSWLFFLITALFAETCRKPVSSCVHEEPDLFKWMATDLMGHLAMVRGYGSSRCIAVKQGITIAEAAAP